ncbi:MAG: class I SAM-dependent methyltransferase [Terriglobales bacterium]
MSLPSALEQVRQESRERLHASLTNPNWLILRRRRQIFAAGLGRLPRQDLSVLDIGGRLQPYRPLLGDRVKSYVAVDLRITPLVNVNAAAEALPFRDEQFDFVICTQVFEYLPDPALAVAEIRRVLRKGGVLFLSAPSVFLRNNEKECWRFLPEGLRHLLREFERVEVLAEGNSLTGFFRTCNVFLLSFLRPRILAPLWQWTFVPFLNVAGCMLQKLGRQNTDFTANYSVWARK